MTRKILGKTAVNSPTKFDGVDGLDQINGLLTGIDQSSDPVDINTTWKFRRQKLKLAEPAAGGSNIFTVDTSAISADKNVTLPLITADDTFEFADTTTGTTLTNKVIPGGSAATEGSNNLLQDVLLYPTHRKIEGWLGGSATLAIGFGIGGTVTAGTAAHTTNSTGKFATWTTAATLNAQAGIRIDSTGKLTMAQGPTFACKFKLPSTANVRFGAYLNTQSTFPTAGSDDPLITAQGIGLFKRSTDTTNFVIGHRGSGGTNVYDDSTKAIDTNVHIFKIKGDAAGGGWQWSWDNGAYTSLLTGTAYPGSTQSVYPSVYVENVEATGTPAKAVDLYWMFVDVLETPSF